MEKPLLTQVLRQVNFKASHERKTASKHPDAMLEITNVDATTPPCNTVLDTAMSNEPESRDEQNMASATVEGVDVDALRIVE